MAQSGGTVHDIVCVLLVSYRFSESPLNISLYWPPAG
jgi:hypothetical protein